MAANTNARYRSLFDTTPDLVILMDETGTVVAVNASVERVLGYTAGELIGRPLARIIPPRYRDAHTEGLRRYLATGQKKLDWSSIHLPGLRADGAEIPLAISFGEFEEGGKRLFTGILRDVTEAKKSADTLEFLARVGPQLAASSLDFRDTLKALAQLAVPFLADWCAIDVVQPGGKVERMALTHVDEEKVQLANELASRYPDDPDAPYGVPQVLRTRKSEVASDIPPSFHEAVAQDERHLELIKLLGLRSYLIAPLVAHDRVYGAITLVNAESRRIFTAADVPIIEELGRRAALAIHNAGLYRDALNANEQLEEQAAELEQQTEEAQSLVEELAEQTDELVTSANDLKQKTSEAEAANKAKSEFLASMSHELRTPLNAIAGYVDLLQMGIRGPVTDEQRTDLERIRSSQLHLLALINDVLNFAKLDAGRVEYRLERVALDQVLKECEAMVLPQIHQKRIGYSYEECGEPVLVTADREKVQQIVLNLLGNAIKFTEEGGTISASCDQDKEFGRVHVTDTGIGIEAEKIQAIFEPFVQVNRSLNQPGDGAGLGLAISSGLAVAMGGEIVVRSEVGKGSTFSLRLPRARNSVDRETGTSSDNVSPASTSATSSS